MATNGNTALQLHQLGLPFHEGRSEDSLSYSLKAREPGQPISLVKLLGYLESTLGMLVEKNRMDFSPGEPVDAQALKFHRIQLGSLHNRVREFTEHMEECLLDRGRGREVTSSELALVGLSQRVTRPD